MVVVGSSVDSFVDVDVVAGEAVTVLSLSSVFDA